MTTGPSIRPPGEILQRDFLEPLGMTQTELARRLDVPLQRVNQIINRRRAITPDSALRLGRLFGTKPEFWLDLQLRWELEEAARKRTGAIERIRPVANPPRRPTAVRERGGVTGGAETAPAATILEAIVERLVEALDPRMIVLFGSVAAGAAGPGSDVDLLIIDDEPFDKGPGRRERLRRARRALSDLRIAKDILIYSADELERWRDSPNHILARALRQGRVLYERP